MTDKPSAPKMMFPEGWTCREFEVGGLREGELYLYREGAVPFLQSSAPICILTPPKVEGLAPTQSDRECAVRVHQAEIGISPPPPMQYGDLGGAIIAAHVAAAIAPLDRKIRGLRVLLNHAVVRSEIHGYHLCGACGDCQWINKLYASSVFETPDLPLIRKESEE